MNVSNKSHDDFKELPQSRNKQCSIDSCYYKGIISVEVNKERYKQCFKPQLSSPKKAYLCKSHSIMYSKETVKCVMCSRFLKTIDPSKKKRRLSLNDKLSIGKFLDQNELFVPWDFISGEYSACKPCVRQAYQFDGSFCDSTPRRQSNSWYSTESRGSSDSAVYLDYDEFKSSLQELDADLKQSEKKTQLCIQWDDEAFTIDPIDSTETKDNILTEVPLFKHIKNQYDETDSTNAIVDLATENFAFEDKENQFCPTEIFSNIEDVSAKLDRYIQKSKENLFCEKYFEENATQTSLIISSKEISTNTEEVFNHYEIFDGDGDEKNECLLEKQFEDHSFQTSLEISTQEISTNTEDISTHFEKYAKDEKKNLSMEKHFKDHSFQTSLEISSYEIATNTEDTYTHLERHVEDEKVGIHSKNYLYDHSHQKSLKRSTYGNAVHLLIFLLLMIILINIYLVLDENGLNSSWLSNLQILKKRTYHHT